MPTFKITLAYDGTDFVGWQRQASGLSIQGALEDALCELDDRAVTVTGAGRTDAGVHALGQVASFSLERPLSTDILLRALNARLPETIRVLSATEAPAAFHARFEARRKTYWYRMWNGDVMSPFERGHAWHLVGALDIERMAAAARLIEGRHDFAAFQGAGSATATTERDVFSSSVTRCITDATETIEDTEGNSHRGTEAQRKSEVSLCLGGSVADRLCVLGGLRGSALNGGLIVYEITGNGFLRHMVRTIVGTLIEIGRGRHAAAWIRDVMASRDRAQAGPTAPPAGLFLVDVEYDEGLLKEAGPPQVGAP
jgi:tRNA pseudouridine38-40 synthase